MKIYEFNVITPKGETISIGQYEGQVLLIVNTATKCGFTPQYEELESIYKKYHDQGFEILDFPCNQFHNQAPGTDEEIQEFCSLNYGTTFPRFSKIEVNGENEHELYTYLKHEKGFAGFNPKHKITAKLEEILMKVNPKYKESPDIKWNFTKFLIDRQGNVVARFEPTEDLAVVEAKIKELL